MDADELLVPWFEALRADVPAPAVDDAHTHVGTHDPSGCSATVAELTDSAGTAHLAHCALVDLAWIWCEAASVLRLLDLYDEHRHHLPHRNQFAPGPGLIMTAATVARTPAATVPS